MDEKQWVLLGEASQDAAMFFLRSGRTVSVTINCVIRVRDKQRVVVGVIITSDAQIVSFEDVMDAVASVPGIPPKLQQSLLAQREQFTQIDTRAMNPPTDIYLYTAQGYAGIQQHVLQMVQTLIDNPSLRRFGPIIMNIKAKTQQPPPQE